MILFVDLRLVAEWEAGHESRGRSSTIRERHHACARLRWAKPLDSSSE